MAKIKKRKLHWKASDSPQVVGYKIYWSDGGKVDYESPSAALGNVTQVMIPDDIAGFVPAKGPIEFGITAVDELGNESDMVTFAAAYQFNVPQAPQDVGMEAVEDYHATTTAAAEETPPSKPIQLYDKGVYGIKEQNSAADEDSPEPEAAEEDEQVAKYYGQSDRE